jgi:quercetin dioxygenase-like cupin family protein
MTEVAASQEMLARLLDRLATLDPADQKAKLAEMMRLVGGEQVAKRPPSGTRSPSPVLISDWAGDGGIVDGAQLLTVGMSPRPVAVPKTRAATGLSLLSNGFLGADLLHLPAHEGFAPHTHPGDHLLFVLGGEGTIAVDGMITPTRAGQVYLIKGAVTHAVGAITDHVILAVGAPHRELTSPERQELVEYAGLLSRFGEITCRICGVSAGCGEELTERGCGHGPRRFA